MKILNYIQGSEEWKNWRFDGITASDISVIMGSNSYKSINDLWDEKVSRVDSTVTNLAMAFGSRNEPLARAWIEAFKNIKLLPHCVVNDTNEVYRCSLDGYDEKNNEIYEIKCPFSIKKRLEASVFNEVELAWIHQVQWQLLVTGVEIGHIAVWDAGTQSCHFIAVKADHELHKEMKSRADAFWEKVLKAEPLPSAKAPLIENNDETYLRLCEQYFDLKNQILDLQKKQSDIKELITKENRPFKCFEYLITEKNGPTVYDTKKMQEDGIDLNLYTKPRSKYLLITKEKQ